MITNNELNEVCRVVGDKVFEYTKKYGKPNFIKIPSRMYRELVVANERSVAEPTLLLGMKICPTVSIERPDEIEVF